MKEWAKKLKEFLFPKDENFTCDVCGREVFENERICSVCKETLPYIVRRCPLCGRKVGEEGLCLDCKERPLDVASARSRFTHDGEAARLVLRFKSGEKYLAATLAQELEPLLGEFPEGEIFTFVPMTERARKRRGYNQSELLARELAARQGAECIPVATKTRETEPQKTLDRRGREENLKGCFRLIDRKAVAGKSFLIIDDTMTTGATAGELAKRLKKAGAVRIDLLTVTSVQRKAPFGRA